MRHCSVAPVMNEAVKIDVKINRKAVLLLSSVIETGLAPQEAKKRPACCNWYLKKR
jgi:hypothetical protein